jgi:hypothetical protein
MLYPALDHMSGSSAAPIALPSVGRNLPAVLIMACAPALAAVTIDGPGHEDNDGNLFGGDDDVDNDDRMIDVSSGSSFGTDTQLRRRLPRIQLLYQCRLRV